MARVDNQDFFFNKQSITDSKGAHEAPKVFVIESDASSVELPDASYIRQADMTRDGQDLILNGPDGCLKIEGYFAVSDAPDLVAPDGTVLTPALVDSFAKNVLKYADAGSMHDGSPVGAVQEVSGTVTITRLDGTVETANIGSPIYEGDIVETDGVGAVNIVFIDETSFAISEDARLAIDEYVFDPETNTGTTDFSVLNGVFVFTSGLIGREDPDDVKIDTPVGSIGIRGTIIAGDVDAGEITVVEGAIVLRNFAGEEMTLATQFETAKFMPDNQTIQHMGNMAANDVGQKFSAVSPVSPTLFSSIHDAAKEQAVEPSEDADTLRDIDTKSGEEGKLAPVDPQTGDGPDMRPQDMPLEQTGFNVNPFEMPRSVPGMEFGKPAPHGGNFSHHPVGPAPHGGLHNPATFDQTVKPPFDLHIKGVGVAGNAVLAEIVGLNTSFTTLNLIGPSNEYFDLFRVDDNVFHLILKPGVTASAAILNTPLELEGYGADGAQIRLSYIVGGYTGDSTAGVNDAAPFIAGVLPEDYFEGSNGSVWHYNFNESFHDPEGGALTFHLSPLTITTLNGLSSGGYISSYVINTVTGALTIDFNLSLPGDVDFDLQVVATDAAGNSTSGTFAFELNVETGSFPVLTLSSDDEVISTQTTASLSVEGDNNTVFFGASGDMATLTAGKTGNVLHMGDGDDSVTIEAGAQGNIIFAGKGDDLIDIASVENEVYGLAGEDEFVLNLTSGVASLTNLHSTGNPIKFDGGAHFDTFKLGDHAGTANETLNFAAIDDSYIKNIEMIDLLNGADNTIHLGYSDVIAMTDQNNQLFIDGDNADIVQFDMQGQGFTTAGTVNHDSQNYTAYTNGDVTLLISDNIAAVNVTLV